MVRRLFEKVQPEAVAAGFEDKRNPRDFAACAGGLSFSRLSGPAFPIGRAQFALQDLASPGKRKRLAAELDAERAVIMGDRLSAMGDDVLGGGIATFLEDHDGVDGLAPFLARDRDHRAPTATKSYTPTPCTMRNLHAASASPCT